jgi:hypothetical protein
MPSSHATVHTERPERYIKQLVSHLGHRLSTELTDDGIGTIGMDNGRCVLTPADGSIEIAASAGDEEALSRLQDVVARHLIRFGGDGELEVAWASSPAA